MSEDQKVDVLVQLIRNKKFSKDYFEVICQFIDQLFGIKFYRNKKFNDVVFEDAEVFDKVLEHLRSTNLNETIREKNQDKKYAYVLKRYSNLNANIFSCLYVVAAILKILSIMAPTKNERTHYAEDAKEMERCARRFICDIFLDLSMSIVIRKNKVHRSIVYYAFSQLCVSSIKAENILHVIEVSEDEYLRQNRDFSRWAKPTTNWMGMSRRRTRILCRLRAKIWRIIKGTRVIRI